MQKKVYNLQFKGGKSCQLEVRGSPLIEHNGKSTFHLVLLSKIQFKELKDHLRTLEIEVVHHFVENETPAAPQCYRCEDCMFYIASERSSCGIDLWTNDEISGYLHSKLAQRDLDNCPLGKKK